ncbi:MAG: hypothetical protein NTZ13_05170 [Candidatus Parcubacteria bacterium]|nr:hypothetical protein [Candidatus Parcubacteria bacterium]
MKPLKYAILAVLFLFVSCKPPQQADPGGRWRGYMDRVASTQKTGASVLIDYECDSSCLILLSSGPGLRISKDAKFGVHETRYVLPHSEYLDNTSKRSEVGTKLFKTLLPECHDLFVAFIVVSFFLIVFFFSLRVIVWYFPPTLPLLLLH